MVDTKWTIKAREFVNCNCSYGCPCQFNGLPTHGHCQAVGGFEIEQGHHGSTKLDGLKFVGIFRWPGAIHEGKGEAAVVIDERATEPQRAALLRILTGQDTEPGATVFNVFASTFEKLHDPIFAPIDFQVDVAGRKARLMVPGVTEGRGENMNPEHRPENERTIALRQEHQESRIQGDPGARIKPAGVGEGPIEGERGHYRTHRDGNSGHARCKWPRLRPAPPLRNTEQRDAA